MRKYDTTFIINGELGKNEREAIIQRIQGLLQKRGAEIERVVRWGLRTLAYEIKKKTRGYYVIFYYFAEPSIIKEVEQELRINENVLRYMTVRFDGTHPSYIPDEGEPGEGDVDTAAVVEESTEEVVPDVELEAEEAVKIPEEEITETTGDVENDEETASEEPTEELDSAGDTETENATTDENDAEEEK